MAIKVRHLAFKVCRLLWGNITAVMLTDLRILSSIRFPLMLFLILTNI